MLARIALILLVIASLPVSTACAAGKTDEELPPRLDGTIARGLAFLARQQTADGALDRDGPKVATTSLGILAFLAAGNVPDAGKYGLVVRNAIEWVLSQQAADGYFGAGDHGMYAHAITTMALAEAYGVENSATRRVRLHGALTRAVAILIDAQNVAKSNPVYAGGWRYERNSQDSDLSCTGWCILALRAAADVGINVPPETRKRAGEFVLKCYDENNKGFAYQPGNAAQPSDTAIGILCLYELDLAESESARIETSIKYLANHPVDENFSFPYYASYYLIESSFWHGDDAWLRIGRPAMMKLLNQQEKEGSWPPSKSGQEPGRIYATAMAVGALAAPYRLLPVYQH